MTVSRASLLGAVVFLGLQVSPAFAQEVRKPIPLTPAEVAPSPYSPGVKTPLRPDIEIDRAADVDRDTAGIIVGDEELQETLWAGSSKTSIAALLNALPEQVESRALRDLLVRVLTMAAVAPTGEGPGLVGIRVERLDAMGRHEAARQLSKAAGQEALDDEARLAIANDSLAGGDPDKACALMTAEAAAGAGADSLKIAAFCFARSGEFARARLFLDLLRDLGSEDALFTALLLRATGYEGVDVVEDGALTQVNLALIEHVGIDPPAAWRDRDDPILRDYRERTRMGRQVRAERAALRGEIRPEALVDIYGEAGEEAKGRAILLRAVKTAPGPEARREALDLLWENALRAGLLVPLARGTIELYEDVPAFVAGATIGESRATGIEARAARNDPAAERAGGTLVGAARAAIAAGRLERAEAWYARLRARDDGSSVPLWPLAALAGFEDHNADRRAWLASVADETDRRRALLALSLLEALGDVVNHGDWDMLLTDFTPVSIAMPAPAVWRGLDMAGRDRRPGEAVLFGVIASGGRPVTSLPVAVSVVRALARVGLVREARAYAVECLLATLES